MDEKQEIPKEIDDHFKLFGKEAWEVEYGDKCPLCNSRFDEFEGCACDSKGCLLYTSPSPRDRSLSRMPSSA